MDALSGYYAAIRNEFALPATIPVRTESGDIGISTALVPFRNSEQAEEMVFSDEKLQRASAAIMACRHAREVLVLTAIADGA